MQSLAAVSPPRQRGLEMERAVILRKLRRFDEAEALIDGVLAAEPAHCWGLMERAMLVRQRGDPAAALEAYRQIVRQHPGYTGVQLPLAGVLRELGYFEEALTAVELFLQAESNHPWGLMERASLCRQWQRPEDALRDYLLLIEHQPDFEPARIQAATLLCERGRLGEAEALLEAAIQGGASGLQLLQQRAHLAEQREPGSGRVWFERALAEHPDAPQAYLPLIHRFAVAGEWEAAISLAERAQQKFPDQPRFPLRKAHLLWRQGRLQNALSLVESLAREFPGEFSVWSQWVQWLVSLGRLEPAERLIGQAQFPDPAARGRIKALQGRAALGGWDLEAALQGYREAAVLQPAEADYQEQLARICACSLELQEARRYLQRATDLLRGRGGAEPDRQREKRYNFIASWINEFTVNPMGLKLSQDAMEVPLPGRVQALAEVLRSEPDYTPAAVLLLIALRRHGRFNAMEQAAGGQGEWPRLIPRRMVRYLEEEAVPERVDSSWRRHCPEFECLSFSPGSATEFLQRYFEPAVTAAYGRCHTPAMRSGLFRLAFLYLHGGIFCEAGDLCRCPLEGLARSDGRLILCQEEYGSIDNRFIAAAPGEPLLGSALDRAVSELLASPRCNPWFTTGPGLISRVAAQLLLPSLRAVGAVDPAPSWIILERPQLLRCISPQEIRVA